MAQHDIRLELRDFSWLGYFGGKEVQDLRKKGKKKKKLWVMFRNPISVGFEKLLEVGVVVWPYAPVGL